MTRASSYGSSHQTINFLNNPGIPQPILQKIWTLPPPPKIKFFLWFLMLNKLQTAENLQRKGWPTITECIMCVSHNQESSDHLFIVCTTAKALTDEIIDRSMQLGGNTIRDKWDSACQRNKQGAWAAVVWTLWRERNRRIFQDQRKNLRALVVEATSYIKQWALSSAAAG
jgi:zinc-binding in reverse transcriptase